jgi:ssDNA-binding replication factor A large subunit
MFIESIIKGRIFEAKFELTNRLNQIVAKKLEEAKKYVASDMLEEFEEVLDEANIVKMGRVLRIRRRIRRNTKGKIVVQRNRRKSAIKGYRLSGNTVKRIPATARISKARKLKRYWKTKGRAKMKRTLLKRKMSLRRRKSMGIK